MADGVMGLECAFEGQTFLWLLVENKLLTWENLQRRGHRGPGICFLWKRSKETTQHLFLDYAFTEDIWVKLKSTLNFDGNWIGNNTNECFKHYKPKVAVITSLDVLEYVEGTEPCHL